MENPSLHTPLAVLLKAANERGFQKPRTGGKERSDRDQEEEAARSPCPTRGQRNVQLPGEERGWSVSENGKLPPDRLG